MLAFYPKGVIVKIVAVISRSEMERKSLDFCGMKRKATEKGENRTFFSALKSE
jgi:hypothetical protein